VTGSTTVGLTDYVGEIVAGGFPGLRHLEGRALTAQLDGYLSRIVTRDFADAGIVVRRPETLTGWLRAYAAATATTATRETIRDAATPGSATKPARSTSIGYSDVLTELRILDPIPA